VQPGILFGTLVQMDWLEDSSPGLDTRVEGRGWMAGPYLSVGLTNNVFFDARLAGGRSDNTVDVGSTYSSNFETKRLLGSARLTGHWAHEQWRFSPNAEVVYFHERQAAFTDQLGVEIGSQSVDLGRLLIGPDISYRIGMIRDVSVELQLGLKGIWDFDRDEIIRQDGITAGTEKFRGRVETGVSFVNIGGASVVAIGSYDGIGVDDYRAYSGRIEARLPISIP